MNFQDAYDSYKEYEERKKEEKDTKKEEVLKDEENRKRPRSRSPNEKECVILENEEFGNFDIPSRQYGDLYCPVCDSHMNSDQMWESHIKGKRHLKNSRKGDSVELKFEYSNEEPTIQEELNKETRPIAGLDHICETLRINQTPLYQCFLCSASLTSSKMLMDHITGLKHRMAFLKEHNKEKYSLLDSSTLSKSYLEPIVQDLISKYEQEHGRGKMSVKKEKGKTGSFSYKKGPKDSKSVMHFLPPRSPSYSPPPKSYRDFSPKPSRRFSLPKFSRRSSPHKSFRQSSPPKSSRHSPPRRSSRYSPPRKSSRYSPPPKSSRLKVLNSETEWQRVSSVRDRSRERIYIDTAHYSDENKWRKMEPDATLNSRTSTYPEVSYSRSGNFSVDSDLRVILEQKKILALPSTIARNNTDVLPSISFSSKIDDAYDQLAHLVYDKQDFFKNDALSDLFNMSVDELDCHMKASALIIHIKKNTTALDLKKKFIESLIRRSRLCTVAQKERLPHGNTVPDTSSQNQFTQNLDNLIGHYKSRKTTPYEDSYLGHSKSSESYNDTTPLTFQLLNNSFPYQNTPERESPFDSGWNQRQSASSLPFQSFSNTPTNIPGLTLTEEPSTSTVMSLFAQKARDIFGNINVPSTVTHPYQNEDSNHLNYRY